MHPVTLPGDSQPRLVGPDDRRGRHRVFDPGLGARERLRARFSHPVDGARRDAAAEEVGERLTGAGDREQLILVQVGGSRQQAGAVADGGSDVGGEGGFRLGAARRAAPGLGPVFGDVEPHGGPR